MDHVVKDGRWAWCLRPILRGSRLIWFARLRGQAPLAPQDEGSGCSEFCGRRLGRSSP